MSLSDVKASYMLGRRHLVLALIAALLLHIAGGGGVMYFMPKQQVQNIPIRTINVRLGEIDDEDWQEPDDAANAPAVESAINDAVREITWQPKKQSKAKILEKPAAKEKPKPMQSQPRQNVREVGQATTPAMLNDMAGEADSQEIMSRYTQLISLWIKKFLVYPDEARISGLEGATVVRVRIDRRGNVRHYNLEYSTGVEMLDKAAIDMIRRANPVPAVPDNYPKGELLEFLIPVSFSLL